MRMGVVGVVQCPPFINVVQLSGALQLMPYSFGKQCSM